MDTFIHHARAITRDAILDFNTARLPALEGAWGKTFQAQMRNVVASQRSQEITKQLSPVMNNCWERQLAPLIPTLKENATDGYDWTIGEDDELPIEDKNSFSEGSAWLGNGFKKTPIHFLKKYKIDETGRVTHAFVAVVDLSKCKSAWTSKTSGFNGSSLELLSVDKEHVHVIHGGLRCKPKWLELEFAPV
jgi:hypothetical protein